MSKGMMFEEASVGKRLKARKKGKRLKYEDKAWFICQMMDENARILTELRGCEGWGFSMSQIATMTRYERSTALMNDLFKMVEAGYLMLETNKLKSKVFSPVEYIFYTTEQHGRALKQKRLI